MRLRVNACGRSEQIFGRTQRDMALARPNSHSNVDRPNLTDRRTRPKHAQTQPQSIEFGPSLARFGQTQTKHWRKYRLLFSQQRRRLTKEDRRRRTNDGRLPAGPTATVDKSFGSTWGERTVDMLHKTSHTACPSGNTPTRSLFLSLSPTANAGNPTSCVGGAHGRCEHRANMGTHGPNRCETGLPARS